MDLLEHAPVGSKTTMRIGGTARWYGELKTREDVEAAWAFAQSHNLPLIVLGAGSNTIFDDEEIQALVVRTKNDAVTVNGNTLTVQTGKILAMLVNECAERGQDLSALTGIPGTVGGALFGNAGQGYGGIWLDHFVKDVTYFDGQWHTIPKEECHFRYRESGFKEMSPAPILWDTTLEVPTGDPAAIKATIESLIKKRIETQPHLKTAGSCFKTLPDGTMAWKLVDAAGLRGVRVGGIEISQKHTNFLLNVDKATFADAVATIKLIREKVPQIAGIEMRFIGKDGRLAV